MCYSTVQLAFLLCMFYRRLGILNIRNKLFFEGNASLEVWVFDFFENSAKKTKTELFLPKKTATLLEL